MTPSLDQFLKDGREKKCVVPRALGKDCSDLCSCCFSFLTALKMLRRAVIGLQIIDGNRFTNQPALLGKEAEETLSDLEQMAKEGK